MERIHLDPACDFVAMKSAESDGVTSDVAQRHMEECERCTSYHRMVMAAHEHLVGLGKPETEVQKTVITKTVTTITKTKGIKKR